jgi:NAD(P)-dependent dehydrogenase (short-subunit alcohol dehydrogenase family)
MRWRNILIAGGMLAIARSIIRQTFTQLADLNGQVVLITGGSRGLGYLLAEEFAKQGCKIAICGRDLVTLDEARQKLVAQGAEVLAVQCDINNQTYVQQLVTEVTLHFGKIDILVNNAAIALIAPVSSLTVADFEDAMGTMYWGTVYASLAVLPQMKARKSGRIVNITSIGGKVSVPHMLTYSSAKFAATGFSEGLRAELLKDGVIVTTVAPGLMRTGSYLRALFKGNHEGEFAWFALGDTLPFISMDAQKAAVQIVEATRRGQSELITTLPAIMAAKINGLFPGQVSNLSALVNRFILPADVTQTDSRVGVRVNEGIDSPVFDTLTSAGKEAADSLNQLVNVHED